VTRRGMIHGRFQPFHNGHLAYLKAAARLCDALVVGITSPDPTRVKVEPEDPQRHLPEANPFTYFERYRMVKAAVAELQVPLERVDIVPFPVNEPDVWKYYVPPGATQYLRLFSEWGRRKLELLRAAGFEVVVLDEGAAKEVSGADVRAALREGGTWETLVPTGVAEVIRASAVLR
jgi:cytidyltransferase-like protein